MKLLKNYIIALTVVAAVTVGLAFLSIRGYLTTPTATYVSSGGVNYARYDDLTLLLTHGMKNATKTDEIPTPPHGYPSFEIQMKTEADRLVGEYSLHVISMINRTALLTDLQTNESYQLSVADFEGILSHEAFSALQAPLPCNQSLTVGQIGDIFASTETKYFFKLNGTFEPIPKGETEIPATQISMTVEEAAEKPQISATIAPDAWSLEVRRDGIITKTQTRVSPSELYFPAEAGDYTYRLTAHWSVTTQRDWYGDADYVLEIHIAEPKAE